MNDNRPIGVFDSGVGGLSVVRQIQAQLPEENVLYLGDTARVPYGSKSEASVMKYAKQAADYLCDCNIKALVIACNTASAVGAVALQELIPDIPVVGVIEPGSKAATDATRNNQVAVIATESTVAGQAYDREIHGLSGEIQIRSKACSLFVSLAEEGWVDGSLVEAILARYLTPLFNDPEHHPDTLVLGCTHYPVLKPAIQNVVGPHVTLVDSAETTARHLRETLRALSIGAHPDQNGGLQLMVTDGPERFSRVAELFLGGTVLQADVKVVDLI